MNRAVLWESYVLCALCLADTFFTILLVKTGLAREANPVMAFYLNQSVAAFIAIKMTIVVAAVVAVEYLRIKNPTFATLAVRLGTLAYLALYVIGDLRINQLI